MKRLFYVCSKGLLYLKMKKSPLAVILVLMLLITQLTPAQAASKFVLEKKNVTVSAVTKNAQIATGEQVLFKGEGFGTNGTVVSIAIVPANLNITDEEVLYDNMNLIYGDGMENNYSSIKGGKFSITTRFVSTYEASPIKKGSYKLIVWWVPLGTENEKTAISTNAFSILGDGKVLPLDDSHFEANPSVESVESAWSLTFSNSAAINLKSGDYIKFEGLPKETALLSGAGTTLKYGNKTANLKASIATTKGSDKKEILMQLSENITIPAKSKNSIVIKKIKNPGVSFIQVLGGIYSKSNQLYAYSSGVIIIDETPPQMTITQKPPETISFNLDIRSEAFTVSVSFNSKEKITGKVRMSLLDNVGNPISSSILAFYEQLGDEHYSYSSSLEGDIVDNKVVFSNVRLASMEGLNVTSFKLRFQDSYNKSVIPVESTSIKIIQSN